uniref:Putative secreted peptide n=1 Tax=Anopheles braziliensis TaxID=58242 RepID=A0A2M3ZPL7_9DIPT
MAVLLLLLLLLIGGKLLMIRIRYDGHGGRRGGTSTGKHLRRGTAPIVGRRFAALRDRRLTGWGPGTEGILAWRFGRQDRRIVVTTVVATAR